MFFRPCVLEASGSGVRRANPRQSKGKPPDRWVPPEVPNATMEAERVESRAAGVPPIGEVKHEAGDKAISDALP